LLRAGATASTPRAFTRAQHPGCQAFPCIHLATGHPGALASAPCCRPRPPFGFGRCFLPAAPCSPPAAPSACMSASPFFLSPQPLRFAPAYLQPNSALDPTGFLSDTSWLATMSFGHGSAWGLLISCRAPDAPAAQRQPLGRQRWAVTRSAQSCGLTSPGGAEACWREVDGSQCEGTKSRARRRARKGDVNAVSHPAAVQCGAVGDRSRAES
jgi:hypothetical protein